MQTNAAKVGIVYNNALPLKKISGYTNALSPAVSDRIYKDADSSRTNRKNGEGWQ